MTTIFCPLGQSQAVTDGLKAAGLFSAGTEVRVARDRYALLGRRAGVFCYITCHPLKASDEVMEVVRRDGYLVVELNDTFGRARATREQNQ